MFVVYYKSWQVQYAISTWLLNWACYSTKTLITSANASLKLANFQFIKVMEVYIQIFELIFFLRCTRTSEEETAGHVLPVLGVTLHHLVAGLEQSVGDLHHRGRLVTYSTQTTQTFPTFFNAQWNAARIFHAAVQIYTFFPVRSLNFLSSIKNYPVCMPTTCIKSRQFRLETCQSVKILQKSCKVMHILQHIFQDSWKITIL